MKKLLLLPPFVAALIVTAGPLWAARPGAPPAEVELEEQAETAYGKNEPAKALELYRKLVALNKNQVPDVFLQIANCLSKLGQVDEAIKTYNAAMKATMDFYKDKDDPERAEQIAFVFLFRGETYAKAGRLKEAVADYRRAAVYIPGNATALASAAWILATGADAGVRDPKQAVEMAQEAQKLIPAPDHLDVLAAALAADGNFAEAVAREKEALAETEDADDKKAYGERLKLYQQKKPFIDPGPAK